jgi:hypothetical protein
MCSRKTFSLDDLRKEFGKNKKIPVQFEAAILVALSHYPELKETRINFKLKWNHKVPYGTTPAFYTIFRKPENRVYNIAILMDAKDPERQALLKNLRFEAQVGVIGHELAHVVQFQRMNGIQLLNALASYLKPAFKRRIERSADLGAIVHGLGRELLEHAIYIRTIPGYVQHRKEINKNYLKPKEIRERLRDNDFFEKYQTS